MKVTQTRRSEYEQEAGAAVMVASAFKFGHLMVNMVKVPPIPVMF
jgi:hypothetical protein